MLFKLMAPRHHNKELYIIVGRDGKATDPNGNPVVLPAGKPKISVPSHTWKVVLVLDPGQGISDVTSDTLAFAINLPNTVIQDPNSGEYIVPDPDSYWEKALINVHDLEQVTGYNFFANVPLEVQRAIENRSEEDILVKLNAIEFLDPNRSFNTTQPAPLTAEVSLREELPSLPISILGSNLDSSIRHGRLPNQVTFSTDRIPTTVRSLEISAVQNAVAEDRVLRMAKISSGSTNTIQGGTSEISVATVSPSQISGVQLSIPDNRTSQVSTIQNGSGQIRSSQVNPSEISVSQIRSAQVNTLQIGTFQSLNGVTADTVSFDNPQQLNSSKVPFSSVISSQQLISTDNPNHSVNLQLLTLYPTVSRFWQSISPLNVALQFTDLPAGQLAESTLTSFDRQGTSIAGTVEHHSYPQRPHTPQRSRSPNSQSNLGINRPNYPSTRGQFEDFLVQSVDEESLGRDRPSTAIL